MREFDFFDVAKILIFATQWTLMLSLIAFIGGGVFGFLLMLMRISKKRILKWTSRFYMEFFQVHRFYYSYSSSFLEFLSCSGTMCRHGYQQPSP
jgi:ABC-type arginine/histidine transport system permease subunit